MLIGDRPVDNLTHKNILLRASITNHVLTHSSGQSALEYLQSVSTLNLAAAVPEMVFVDWDMPLMSGLQFIEMCNKHLNQLPQRFHLVVLADVFNEVEARLCKTYPMVLDFIAKPLENQLLKLTSQVLI